MAIWNSRGLRGSGLEEEINITNERYRSAGLALIQKVPTPITPIEMDKSQGHITLAYFDQKSTVDYIGAVQGIPVCFDAKECHEETFSLQNVHEHQVEFMRDFSKQEGIAFLVIYYSKLGKYYYMRFEELLRFWERAANGGRKSFRLDELDEDYFFTHKGSFLVPYIDMIQKDLDAREEKA